MLGECDRVALVRSLEMVEEVADADCKTMQTARWFLKLTEQVIYPGQHPGTEISVIESLFTVPPRLPAVFL